MLRKGTRFAPLSARIEPRLLRQFMSNEARRLEGFAGRLRPAPGARLRRAQSDLDALARRLQAANVRMISEAQRRNREGHAQLAALAARLERLPQAKIDALSERLDRLDRMRQTLGYRETLKRGYAVVRGPEGVVTSAAQAGKQPGLEIEFADDRLAVIPGGGGATASIKPKPAKPARKKSEPPPDQGSLF